MDLIYMDYNCFQRGFDDHEQPRIQMEAIACQAIFDLAEKGEVELAWSFVHEVETEACPIEDRQLEALRLSQLCKKRIGPEDPILKIKADIQSKESTSGKDALHLASALHIKAGYFLTCDDRLMKQAQRTGGLKAMNPTEYLRIR